MQDHYHKLYVETDFALTNLKKSNEKLQEVNEREIHLLKAAVKGVDVI